MGIKKLRLEEIVIPKGFEKSTPKPHKLAECKEAYLKTGKQDRYLVVNKRNNMLIDGYIMYLILKELGVEEAEVKYSNTKKERWNRKTVNTKQSYRNTQTTYIYAKHPNSDRHPNNDDKEYVWRIPKAWTNAEEIFKAGDRVYVATRFGIKEVIVTKVVTLNESPVEHYVKRVIGKVVEEQ